MELRIFKSIMYGHLRPWLFQGDEKFFRTHLTPTFANPSTSIDEYYKVLKSIFNNNRELFDDESLDVYLRQPHSNSEYQILQPVVEVTLPPATNAKERFYYALIKNEATRTSNNVFQALSKKLQDYDRKYIVNVFKSNLVAVLSNFPSVVQSIESPDATTQAILNALKLHTVRLLKETELLYPQFLNSLPSDDAQIFMEYLKEEIPNEEYLKESEQVRQIKHHLKEVYTGIKLKTLANPNAISFGYTGNKDNLKATLQKLELAIDLLKNETSSDYLYEVLTSNDIDLNGPKIFLGINTNEFRYIINQLKPKFKNLKLSVIEQTDLFRSKDNPHQNLKARTLSSSTNYPDYAPNKATINSIIKEI